MKVVSDTLKSPDGKWSRKSLTSFTSFAIAITIGIYIVSSDFFLTKEINKYAISVFDSFIILAGYLLGVSVLDKLQNKNKLKGIE